MVDKCEKNLLANPCIQTAEEDVSTKRTMTTWHKRDWQQFYELARRPWQRHRPPRPVYPTGLNRVLPAQGFSLSELDDAGVDLDQAELLGLPVDAGRIDTSAQTSPCSRLRTLLSPTALITFH